MTSEIRLPWLVTLVCLLLPGLAGSMPAMASASAAEVSPLPARVAQAAEAMAGRPESGASNQSIVVDVPAQRLYLFERGAFVAAYPVSTAERGTGNREGSMRTPLGLHRVAKKVGAEAPIGMIFRGRQATGEIAEILAAPDQRAERDDVTTRILWLDGLEPGVNRGGDVDSKGRYIYIHGTPEEGRIGRPASHGCVRMTNADVIELFERVAVGTLVDIIE